jgi:hypothetical protein
MNLSTLSSRATALLKTLRYGDRVRPFRDWLAVMCIVGVLLVASAGWSYLVFQKTSDGEILGAPTTALAPISTASLDTVRTVFDKRAAERMHYLSDYRFVDPSK